MGTIYPRGKKLYVGYRTAAGAWKYAATGLDVGREKDAQKVLDKIEARVAAGLELGEQTSGPLTLKKYSEQWCKARKNKFRSTNVEEGRLKKHVYPRIGDMNIEDVKPRHILRMVEELRDGGKLAPRTIRRIYGTLHTLFQRALVDELVSMNPCVLGRHELGPNVDKDPEWRATAIYSREELECLISSDLIPWDRQVLYAIEGLAGLRHGEAVGFRWRNYDARMKPLGQILVARSYDHDTTKTGHSRLVPVHPTLAAILAEWKLKGWVEMMGRRPTPDDLVIPSREGAMRSRHHSRNKLLDDLRRLGLRHRRGHDLRRTFITLARADGARADLLQMVTHDQKKDIINIYTSMPWAPLCEEVAKLKIERRKGHLLVLPKASSGEDEPQLAMFDGSDAPAETASLTSLGTSVQNTTKPDPKKLWDVRPLLKRVLVEAPGIEP